MSLRDFFLTHMTELYFIYGMSFILMAIAITIQVKQNPYNKIHKDIWLLAIFGYLHGLSEWTYFYIPYKEGDWSSNAIFVLEIIDINLVGISFWFLLLYGLSFLYKFKNQEVIKNIKYLTYLILFIWIGYFVLYRLILVGNNLDYWFNTAEIVSRYLFGFPGGIIAGAAVYMHNRHLSVEKNIYLHYVYRLLALSFVAYGILAGAFVTPMNFFPASFINKEMFFQIFSIPVPFFRAGFSLLITFCIVYILRTLQHENIELINKTTAENAILIERKRIKKDLHDDVIQAIYAVGLGLESCRSQLGESGEGCSNDQINKAVDELNKVISNLRLHIHDLKTAEYAYLSLEEIIEKLVEKFKYNLDIKVINNLKSSLNKDINIDIKANLYLIIGEILINAIKHAKCTQVTIELTQPETRKKRKNNSFFLVRVIDNGVGIDLNKLYKEQENREKMGLLHVQERMNILEGSFRLKSAKNKGTEVELEFPLNK